MFVYNIDDLNPCTPNLCQHNGQCVVENADAYTCQCPNGYGGPNCEISKNFFPPRLLLLLSPHSSKRPYVGSFDEKLSLAF